MKERFRAGAGPMSRREFLGGLLIGGAGLALGCRGAQLAGSLPVAQVPEPEAAVHLPGPKSRRVWAISDSHVGLVSDERDGAEWLQICVEDVRAHAAPADYVLALGDLTHNAGAEKELATYARIREGSGLPAWYEIAGNHDYAAVPAGLWRKHIGKPARYALIDGSLAWFLFSAEQGRSDGLVSPATAAWLKRSIAAHQDRRNIVVCSHQAVFDTVMSSADPATSLNDPTVVAGILKDVRVDLWLCGHIHNRRQNKGCIVTQGRTTFIDVASVNHAYGTRAANGYLFEMAEGAKTMQVRCREHDFARDRDDLKTTVTFPHPWTFQAKPELVPFAEPVSSRRLERIGAVSAVV